MNRKELDAFVAHHGLAPEAVEVALDISGARPSAPEMRHFAMSLLQLAGVLSLAAGVVFFVAANWQDFGIAGRFGLVQIVLVVSVALAFWRPPPQRIGRCALLMAFISTGALLALFGQTYQTGADLYELFLTWAVLGFAFVVAGQWSVLCAAWLLVLNVSLLLFFGWRSQGGWLWVLFSPWHVSTSLLLLVPTAINLLLWMFTRYLTRTQWNALAPGWIGRFALACAFGYATWAGGYAITQSPVGGHDWIALLAVLGLEAAIAVYALRMRSDVFPLTLAAASLIVLGTLGLAAHSGAHDLGIFFILAIWLIASSTISGRILMSLVRAWRVEGQRA